MQPVQSSAISDIGYDTDKQKLKVAFKTGQTWEYDDVPAHHHDALMQADSIGQHFHKHIRDAFNGRKVG